MTSAKRFWKLGALLALNGFLALVVLPAPAVAGGGGGGACSQCYEYSGCGGDEDTHHSFVTWWDCDDGPDPEQSREDSHTGIYDAACIWNHSPYFHESCS